MFPRPKLGRKADRPNDPRMPVLARVHHVRPRQLGHDIQLHQRLDGLEPRAC